MQNTHIKLYKEGNHHCLAFNDLVTGEGVQANQFLIRSGEDSMLIDPGGDLTYIPMSIELSRHMKLRELKYIFASHQDPDIIASIDRWVTNTDCRVIVSKLWSRFLPHLVSAHVGKQIGSFSERMIPLPDRGSRMPFGDGELYFIPAHFLHSVGNFQVYDPKSRILFSGDMGASVGADDGEIFVTDFAAHVAHMKGFHQRYMCSQKVMKLWADMVRTLKIDMIVPQHGKAFKGVEMINQFLDWASNLPCGVDRMTKLHYQCPNQILDI